MCRIFFIVAIFILGILLGGCIQTSKTPIQVHPLQTAIVSPGTITGTILACVNKQDSLSRKTFEELYKDAVEMDRQEEDRNFLLLVCLGLTSNASYKQFITSTNIIQEYFTEFPDNTNDLKGLHLLLIRQNKTKMKWQYRYKKMNIEKNSLEKQIDQLKNIEKIITDKEHTDPLPKLK